MAPALRNRSALCRLGATIIAVQLVRAVFVGSLLSSSSAGLTVALQIAQPEMIFALLATVVVCALVVQRELQFRLLMITSICVLGASTLGLLFLSREWEEALDRLLPIATFIGDKGPSQMIICQAAFGFGVLMSLRLPIQVLPWTVGFGFSAVLGIALASGIMKVGSALRFPAFGSELAANILSSFPFAFVCACLVARYYERFAGNSSPEQD